MKTDTLKIAVLAGDGIGPETTREAIKVLRAVEKRHSLNLELSEAPAGWEALGNEGKALPESTLAQRKQAGAILFETDVSPLRPERQGEGIDIVIVRELTGGLYSNYPKKTQELLEVRRPRLLFDCFTWGRVVKGQR